MIQEWCLALLMIQELRHCGFTNDTGIMTGFTNDTSIVSLALQMKQELCLTLQMI